jgi:hypothetical protein
MKPIELAALAGLAFVLLQKRSPRGIVIPLDDELVQIRPPKKKAAPGSLEDELAAQDEGSGPLEERTPYVPPPATRSDTASPPAMTDELFASVAADASLPPSTAANVPPTQKESTPFLPAPARPTAPATAPTGTTEGPTDNVSPLLQPRPQGPQIPAGYDPAKARAGAAAIASHLAKKGPAGYSHEQLKIWQRQAALTPDGVYGGSTRGALIAFGVTNPPRPFFKPVATIPYVPPEQRT